MSDQAEIKADGWANVLTGLGMASRDKRKGSSFVRDGIMRARGYLEDLYAGDDMAARIVDALPDEMTREWIELQSGDSELDRALMAQLEVLDVRFKVRQALIWARLFGGACLILGVDDGQTTDKPLDYAAIKSLRYLTVLDRWSLRPGAAYADPLSPRYGKPETYRIEAQIATSGSESTQSGVVVHESRLLRFDSGVVVTPRRATENETWSDSVLERVAELLPDFHSVYSGTSNLVQDFAQGVYKLKNLAAMLAAGSDAQVIKRLQLIDISRSVARAIVLDADSEEFTREMASLAGIPDVMDRWQSRLAAAARMPVSVLMGLSPAGGLAATGEFELRYWYDQVKSTQESALRPQIEKLLRVMLIAKDGPTRGVEPETWKFSFRSLWQQTDAEKADARNKQSQTDASYISSGVLSPDEVAASRFSGAEYSFETKLDTETREAFNVAEDSGAALVEEADETQAT